MTTAAEWAAQGLPEPLNYNSPETYEGVVADLGFDPLALSYDPWAKRHAIPSTVAAMRDHLKHAHKMLLARKMTRKQLDEMHDYLHNRTSVQWKHTHTNELRKKKKGKPDA
jgi:hypothetical protein